MPPEEGMYDKFSPKVKHHHNLHAQNKQSSQLQSKMKAKKMGQAAGALFNQQQSGSS